MSDEWTLEKLNDKYWKRITMLEDQVKADQTKIAELKKRFDDLINGYQVPNGDIQKGIYQEIDGLRERVEALEQPDIPMEDIERLRATTERLRRDAL